MTLSVGPILGVRLSLQPFALAAYWLLTLAIFAVGVPGSPPMSLVFSLLLGLAAAAVLLASYAAHEMAHAIVAHRLGMPINELRLFAIGDRSRVDAEPTSGRAEALVALAGLVVSVVLGGVLFGIWSALPASTDEPSLFVRGLAWWSAVGNLALAAINAVPAYPYDGGRLVRGIAWAVRKDKLRGTRVASMVGRVAALAMMFSGAAYAFVTADLFVGLWLVIVGLFLLQSSRRQYRHLQISRAVEGLVVSDVMDENVATVGPNLTLDTLFGQYERDSAVESYPVTADGVLLGSIAVDQIRRIPRAAWPRTRVTDVMTSLERLPTVTGRESVMDALLRFDRLRLQSLPVVDEDGKHLVGLLTRERLLEKLWPRVRRMAEQDGAKLAS